MVGGGASASLGIDEGGGEVPERLGGVVFQMRCAAAAAAARDHQTVRNCDTTGMTVTAACDCTKTLQTDPKILRQRRGWAVAAFLVILFRRQAAAMSRQQCAGLLPSFLLGTLIPTYSVLVVRMASHLAAWTQRCEPATQRRTCQVYSRSNRHHERRSPRSNP